MLIISGVQSFLFVGIRYKYAKSSFLFVGIAPKKGPFDSKMLGLSFPLFSRFQNVGIRSKMLNTRELQSCQNVGIRQFWQNLDSFLLGLSNQKSIGKRTGLRRALTYKGLYARDLRFYVSGESPCAQFRLPTYVRIRIKELRTRTLRTVLAFKTPK